MDSATLGLQDPALVSAMQGTAEQIATLSALPPSPGRYAAAMALVEIHQGCVSVLLAMPALPARSLALVHHLATVEEPAWPTLVCALASLVMWGRAARRSVKVVTETRAMAVVPATGGQAHAIVGRV